MTEIDVAADHATIPYRVRFDECGADGRTRASVHLRQAQDAAWIHSERLGFDRAWHDERGVAWVVRAIDLALLRPTGSADLLEVTTRLVGFRRFWLRRHTEFRDRAGLPVCVILTDWVLLDARGTPTRMPSELQDHAAALALGPFEPTRLAHEDPPPGAATINLVARPTDIDPYGHANNAVYVDWLEAAVTAAAAAHGPRVAREPDAVATVPRRYRLEYLLPTGDGEALTAAAWPDAGGTAVLLRDGAGGEHLRGRLDPGA